MIIYFSGTGNSEWVAKRLSELTNDRYVSLYDVVVKQDNKVTELTENESLGFVFPVYSWGPPEVVLHLIKDMVLNYNPDMYLYFVCTCGDDTGKTSQLFKAAVESRGWRYDAGYSITMPNTYVCMPGFDVDSEELRDKKLFNANQRVVDIARQVNDRLRTTDCHEGGIPWLKSYAIRPLFNRFYVTDKKFCCTTRCVSCGKCSTVCPVGNIDIQNGRPKWKNNCTMCLACYHNCPVKAIEWGSATKNKGQYTHP